MTCVVIIMIINVVVIISTTRLSTALRTLVALAECWPVGMTAPTMCDSWTERGPSASEAVLIEL